MEDIYYEKKKNKKGMILGIVFTILLIVLFYGLNFFNINPPYMMKIINNGSMPNDAYNRDFIFTIFPKNNTGDIPELEVVLNESTNTGMSESLQDISLIIGKETFEWRKFYKFDTLIEKTPYDTRYVKIDKYADQGYKYSYKENKSLLLNNILSDVLGNNTNALFTTRKFDTKKIKINAYEKQIDDKIKFVYELSFSKEEASKIFERLYGDIWNNEEFSSFFREDNEIQQKIKVENNTKNILDVLDNIKKNLTVNNLKMTVILNKDYPESVVLDFEADYIANSSKTTINIGLSEFLKDMGSEYSPENSLDIVSVTPIEQLTGGEKSAK